MILQFTQWLENLDFFTYIRGSSDAYPVILALHLTALSLFGGMILMTDLRLLGWGMRSRPVADVVNGLRIPKRVGFIIAATCGVLLASSKAEEYYYNPFFRIKLLLFVLVAVHAWFFRPRVYNKAAEIDRSGHVPSRARWAGALSLILWISIATAGRSIGYVHNDHHLHYATLHHDGAVLSAVIAR